MADRGPTVVFCLGGPGAGKGTQCARLQAELGFHHLSAGDLLRAERQQPGSQYGDMIEGIIKEGKLVPSEITVKLLENAMRLNGWEGGKFVIDGFPRNDANQKAWDEVVGDKADVKGCLFFDCPLAVMETRLLERGQTSGRVDDNIESIRKRFQTYHDETLPILEHYKQRGQLQQIDTSRDVDSVWADVKTIAASY
mmetsp:Transcript_4175/g.9286  ORF Transcript_4175/g.9286 Transcript_4175/m.9286 type:complete len:196 (-) Transcript_4175:16-603(-)